MNKHSVVSIFVIHSRQGIQQPGVEFTFSSPKHSREELSRKHSLDSIAMQPLPNLPTITTHQVTDC